MSDEKMEEIGEGGMSQGAVNGAWRITLVGLWCESVPWTPAG